VQQFGIAIPVDSRRRLLLAAYMLEAAAHVNGRHRNRNRLEHLPLRQLAVMEKRPQETEHRNDVQTLEPTNLLYLAAVVCCLFPAVGIL
jgi:hypothetical protein